MTLRTFHSRKGGDPQLPLDWAWGSQRCPTRFHLLFANLFRFSERPAQQRRTTMAETCIHHLCTSTTCTVSLPQKHIANKKNLKIKSLSPFSQASTSFVHWPLRWTTINISFYDWHHLLVPVLPTKPRKVSSAGPIATTIWARSF